MTWSPFLTLATPGPSSATMPAASWPSTIGSGNGQSPFMMCQSLMHTPAALTCTRTSFALGGSCSRSRICKGLLTSVSTAARMWLPPGVFSRGGRRTQPRPTWLASLEHIPMILHHTPSSSSAKADDPVLRAHAMTHDRALDRLLGLLDRPVRGTPLRLRNGDPMPDDDDREIVRQFER